MRPYFRAGSESILFWQNLGLWILSERIISTSSMSLHNGEAAEVCQFLSGSEDFCHDAFKELINGLEDDWLVCFRSRRQVDSCGKVLQSCPFIASNEIVIDKFEYYIVTTTIITSDNQN
jgi:hypothetical protein